MAGRAYIDVKLKDTKEFKILVRFVDRVARGVYRGSSLACQLDAKDTLTEVTKKAEEEATRGD